MEEEDSTYFKCSISHLGSAVVTGLEDVRISASRKAVIRGLSGEGEKLCRKDVSEKISLQNKSCLGNVTIPSLGLVLTEISV